MTRIRVGSSTFFTSGQGDIAEKRKRLLRDLEEVERKLDKDEPDEPELEPADELTDDSKKELARLEKVRRELLDITRSLRKR